MKIKISPKKLHERLEADIREKWHNKHQVYQIVMNLENKQLIFATSPVEKVGRGIFIDMNNNRYDTFLGIPIITDLDLKSDWELRIEEKYEIFQSSR